MSRRAVLVAALLAAALAGCAGMPGAGTGPLVEPGARQVGDTLTVQAPIAWTQFRDRQRRAELWTVNGPALDAIYFYYGVRAGESLLPQREGTTLPTVRAGMAAHEVQEFFADSLTRSGAVRVQTDALRPARLGTRDGFAFDLHYTSADGLDYQGFAQGVWHGERLVFMYFSAPVLHFYPSLAPAAQKLFASAQLR